MQHNMTLTQALQLSVQHIQTGKLSQAQEVLGQILKQAPSHPDARHLLGVSLLQQQEYGQAEKEIKKSLQANPKFAMAHFNLGNVYMGQGNPDKAISTFQKALKIKPDYVQAAHRLCDALYMAERFDEAEIHYRALLEKTPDNLGLMTSLADMLDTQGKWDAAINIFQQAVKLAPNDAILHVKLANTLNQAFKSDQAETVILRALELAPDLYAAHLAHAYILLRQGRAEEGLAAANKTLALFPGETTAIAWKITALDQLGGGTEYDRYMDFETFVKPQWVETPKGFRNINHFNEAIVRHVVNHPQLFSFEHYEVTRHGQEVKDIYAEPMGPIKHLKAAMEKHVTDYINSLPDDPDNHFVANAPKKWRLKSWANILSGPGRQIAHIHGEAWLSGCYYVRLPDIMKTDENPENAGYIEFGQINDEFPNLETNRLKFLRPQEGLVALFPSYLYHSTVPTQSTQPRIAIAFDVVPVE